MEDIVHWVEIEDRNSKRNKSKIKFPIIKK